MVENTGKTYDFRLKVAACIVEFAIPLGVALVVWWDEITKALKTLFHPLLVNFEFGPWMITAVVMPLAIWYACSGFVAQCKSQSNAGILVHAITVVSSEIITIICIATLGIVGHATLVLIGAIIVGAVVLLTAPSLKVVSDVTGNVKFWNVAVPGIAQD